MHKIFEINEEELALEQESVNIDRNHELPGSECHETDSVLDTISTDSSSKSEELTGRADTPNEVADPKYKHIDKETSGNEVFSTLPTLGNVLQMEYNEIQERLSEAQIHNNAAITTLCTGRVKNGQRQCTVKHKDFTYCPLQKMPTHEQIQRILKPGHNHTLGDNCLVSQIINTNENLRLDTIAILFNSYSKANAIRKRQNEKLEQDKELSNDQVTTIREPKKNDVNISEEQT